MVIEFYGDSFVWGGCLHLEYALKKQYIETFWDKKFGNNIAIKDECENFLMENRWTKLMQDELGLNYKIENYGFSGAGWQYIHYLFIKNQVKKKDTKEDKLYIFCPPRIEFKRLITDINYENNKLNFVTFDGFKIMNIVYDKYNRKNEQMRLLNDLFSTSVTDQLNFQNVFAILNYLVANKKKFIFLPSWQNSLRDSFIFKDKEESTLFNKKLNEMKNKILFISGFNQKNNSNKEYDYKKEICLFYDEFIFNHIDDIVIENFWNKQEYRLLSGHPNLIAQDLIKDEYLKIIKNHL